MLKENTKSHMNVDHPNLFLQCFCFVIFGCFFFFFNKYVFSACYIYGDIAISHFLFYFSEVIINLSLAFHSFLCVIFTMCVGFDITGTSFFLGVF